MQAISDFLEHNEWVQLFESCDFNVVAYQTDPNLWTTTYLLRNKYETRPHKIVNIDDVESFEFVENMKTELGDVYDQGANHNVWLMNSGVSNKYIITFLEREHFLDDNYLFYALCFIIVLHHCRKLFVYKLQIFLNAYSGDRQRWLRPDDELA